METIYRGGKRCLRERALRNEGGILDMLVIDWSGFVIVQKRSQPEQIVKSAIRVGAHDGIGSFTVGVMVD